MIELVNTMPGFSVAAASAEASTDGSFTGIWIPASTALLQLPFHVWRRPKTSAKNNRS